MSAGSPSSCCGRTGSGPSLISPLDRETGGPLAPQTADAANARYFSFPTFRETPTPLFFFCFVKIYHPWIRSAGSHWRKMQPFLFFLYIYLFYPSSLTTWKDWHSGTQSLATIVTQLCLLLMLAIESKTRLVAIEFMKWGPAEDGVEWFGEK